MKETMTREKRLLSGDLSNHLLHQCSTKRFKSLSLISDQHQNKLNSTNTTHVLPPSTTEKPSFSLSQKNLIKSQTTKLEGQLLQQGPKTLCQGKALTRDLQGDLGCRTVLTHNDIELKGSSSQLSFQNGYFQSGRLKQPEFLLQQNLSNQSLSQTFLSTRNLINPMLASSSIITCHNINNKTTNAHKPISKTNKAVANTAEIHDVELGEISVDIHTETKAITYPPLPQMITVSQKDVIINLKMKLLDEVSSSLIGSSNLKNPKDKMHQTILDSCQCLAKLDPEFILKVALYGRHDLNIRTTTNLLLAIAANLEECRTFIKKYYSSSVHLPTD
uniref:TROVE domain-containing protein n=1 Tax=Ciona intestinalis TaxID=7719 RepID=H2XS48_CIOIN